MTHSKYVCKHILWVLQFEYMPYYMGFGVPWLYVSEYWHFGHISHFPRAEVLEIIFLCFGPQLMVIKGLKASGCFQAKAKGPSPLGTRYTTFGVNTFGTTNQLFCKNGTKSHLPLNVRPRAVCAHYPRLRAIWKGDISPPQTGCIPLCPLLGMGEPRVTQYGVCCLLPVFRYYFSAKGKNG